MGLIANGGATETIEIPGNGPIISEINITSGMPAIISEVFQGNVPDGEIEASLGASWANGGLFGWDVGVAYTPDTQQATVEVSLSGFGGGGSFGIEGTWDPDRGLFLINDASSVEAFTGVNIILGDQQEFLGFTFGNTANVKAGVFF